MDISYAITIKEMDVYVNEAEYAVTHILHAIWHEHQELQKLHEESKRLFSIAQQQIEKAQKTGTPISNTQDIDKVFLNGNEINELKKRVAVKKFSNEVLAGALLQIAKQGISIIHGGLEDCPDGRYLGRHKLKDLIWYGRNQSIHWEENKKNTERDKLFLQLCLDFGFNEFQMFKSKSVAHEIVKLLEWDTFEKFKTDLLLLR